jgi:hypothetical protein
MDKDLIKMRDAFRDIANVMDELLELEVRAADGEDVEKESESVAGRLLIKMMQVESMSNK